jgi:hypothetical protein
VCAKFPRYSDSLAARLYERPGAAHTTLTSPRAHCAGGRHLAAAPTASVHGIGLKAASHGGHRGALRSRQASASSDSGRCRRTCREGEPRQPSPLSAALPQRPPQTSGTSRTTIFAHEEPYAFRCFPGPGSAKSVAGIWPGETHGQLAFSLRIRLLVAHRPRNAGPRGGSVRAACAFQR